jgi:hypothetical protein
VAVTEAEADAAEDNPQDGDPPTATPRALAMRAGRRERLAAGASHWAARR